MTDAVRRLVPALYALAIYHVISPVYDVATSVWPFNPGDERWRYSLAGYASNYAVSALFGVMLFAIVAATAKHRRVLRVTGIFSALGATLMLVMVLGLMLDALQLMRQVDREMLASFRIGVTKAGIKLALEGIVLLLIAIGCFKGARELPRTGHQRASSGGAPEGRQIAI